MAVHAAFEARLRFSEAAAYCDLLYAPIRDSSAGAARACGVAEGLEQQLTNWLMPLRRPRRHLTMSVAVPGIVAVPMVTLYVNVSVPVKVRSGV